jgi:hypothetical protein
MFQIFNEISSLIEIRRNYKGTLTLSIVTLSIATPSITITKPTISIMAVSFFASDTNKPFLLSHYAEYRGAE